MIDTKINTREIEVYTVLQQPDPAEKNAIIDFLHTHLEQYGDKWEDIEKAYDYAVMGNNTSGGFVVTIKDGDNLIGASIINRTGMEGYIPENILVYIATHKDYRGKGIGKKLMQKIIDTADGNIALHVEHDNPALHLYKKLGFTNKYLEMRLNKKDK